MHSFGTDSDERRNIILVLALLSIVVVLETTRILSSHGISVPWWIGSPSVMTVFGILYATFDNWAWCWRMWKKLHLVQVPNLTGHWQGTLVTSFDRHSQPYSVHMSISQKWTAISILLDTDQSESWSLSGCLLVKQPGGVTLSFLYRNDPKANATQTMQSHRGTTTLRLLSDGCLEGEYYTGRGRETFGRIRVRRAC